MGERCGRLTAGVTVPLCTKPSLSLAAASSAMGAPFWKVAPSAGAVICTAGGVLTGPPPDVVALASLL